MAKKADVSAPSSLKDVAYRFAVNGETTHELAKFVFDKCPTFLESVPDEIRAELRAGFILRKQEITEPVHYKMVEGKFIPVTDTTVEGLTVMTPVVAMSWSQHEFGQLKRTDPALYAIAGSMRDKVSTYVSDKMKALTAAVKVLANEGKVRQRAVNKTFVEALETVFDTFDKKVKTAKDRGDPNANPVKYRMARDAFWKTFNA